MHEENEAFKILYKTIEKLFIRMMDVVRISKRARS